MVLDVQKKKYGRTQQAIEETIRICEEQDILVEYLKTRKVEVQNIMYTLFDQERINELNNLNSRKEGKLEGKLETLVGLVKDKIISISEGAKRADMTEKAFSALVQ